MSEQEESKALTKLKECDWLGTYEAQYVYAITRFLKWSQKKDYDELVKLPPIEISELIQKYVKDLIQVNSDSYIKNNLDALHLFYSQNGIEFNYDQLMQLLPYDNRILGIPYTDSEIKTMYGIINKPKNKIKSVHRNRALFLFVASSGCPFSDIEHLQIQDLIPVQDTYAVEINIHIPSIKGNFRSSEIPKYTTFVTPQARKMLDKYLKTREDLNDYSSVFDQSLNTIHVFYNRLTRKAAINRTNFGGTHRMSIVQGFRKRFYNLVEDNFDKESIQLMKSKIFFEKQKKLSEFELQKLYKKYQKIVPNLTI